MTVSVLLNGEEAKVDLVQLSVLQVRSNCHHPANEPWVCSSLTYFFPQDFRHFNNVDAYVIIFSVTDRSSFYQAVDLLHALCKVKFALNINSVKLFNLILYSKLISGGASA